MKTMNKIHQRTCLAACTFAMWTHTMPAHGQHGGDIVIGAKGGSLAWSPNGALSGQEYFPLARVEDGFLVGWTGDDPGFDHLITPDPTHALVPLSPGALIWLRIVEIDPALILIDDAFQVLEHPGDRAFLGDHELHGHFTWFIEEENPAFDPEQCVWRVRFLLEDKGPTFYADSETITLEFTNEPLREARGDVEPDGDVDADDVTALTECLRGPGQRPDPDDAATTTCEVDCVNAFDVDDDRDVDLSDVAAFQGAFTGPR